MTTLLNNTSFVVASAASPSTQKRSAAMIANFKSSATERLSLASAPIFQFSLPGMTSLRHKTTTLLPAMFDDDLDLFDGILKQPNQDGEDDTNALRELPSRICEITLGVLDSTLRQSQQSHEEYKKELLLDNLTFLSCNDHSIDEDLLSEGDIEECDSDDEGDIWVEDSHLPTPSTISIDYEMPLVDTVTSSSKYRHQQESTYRKELLLDSGDDLDHILKLARCRDVLNEDALSQGDIESDCESDDDFIPESLSDKYHTMDRCIERISPSSE